MEINGHIQQGIVVPDDELSLPDGTEVTIVVGNREPSGESIMSTEAQARYDSALRLLDGMPNEKPGDQFSGADHDQALYGGSE